MKRWIMERLKDREVIKYLKFGAIPLAAVIMIVVILIADKPQDKNIQKETQETESIAETTAPTLEPQMEAKLGIPLGVDQVPEINSLMETYFQARISCDPQALSQIFEAGSLGDETAMIERMEQQTEHIETYQNISCYTKEGLEPDSYIVFARFDIKFYRTETLAPSLLWCYVRKGEDGSYRIVEIPDEKTSLYITEIEKTEEVIALSKSVNKALEEAIASDGKLAAIYNILRSGVVENNTAKGEAAEGAQSQSTAETLAPEHEQTSSQPSELDNQPSAALESTQETAAETTAVSQ